MLALLNVRNSTQVERGDLELMLQTGRWQISGVEMHSAVFEFAGKGPLSWELKDGDREQLRDQWARYHGAADPGAAEAMRTVGRFFDGPAEGGENFQAGL